MSPEVPYSHHYDSRGHPRARETLPYLRQYFDTVRPVEPWAVMPEFARFHFARAWGASRYRLVLEGPVGRAWFLGERFMRQTLGLPL